MKIKIKNYKKAHLDILDVANYCIKYLNNVHVPLKNIELNQFVFNMYRLILKEKKIILFDEEFVYGLYGPLNESLYDSLKGFQSIPITETVSRVVYTPEKPFDYQVVPYNVNDINLSYQLLFDEYLESSLNLMKKNDDKYMKGAQFENYRKIIPFDQII